MSDYCQEIWSRCLDIIRDNISEDAYKTWFMPIIPVSLDKSVLTIEVPSDFVRDQIESNYISLLSKAMRREIGQDARLIYKIKIADGGFIRERQKQTSRVSNREVAAPGVAQSYNGNPYLIPGRKHSYTD